MLVDMLVCPEERTFRRSSSILSAGINFAYMGFLYVTSKADGCYPYAFLESLPEPLGILLTAGILVAGVEGLFLAAKQLKKKVL